MCKIDKRKRMHLLSGQIFLPWPGKNTRGVAGLTENLLKHIWLLAKPTTPGPSCPGGENTALIQQLKFSLVVLQNSGPKTVVICVSFLPWPGENTRRVVGLTEILF